jgi:hypothetical protein
MKLSIVDLLKQFNKSRRTFISSVLFTSVALGVISCGGGSSDSAAPAPAPAPANFTATWYGAPQPYLTDPIIPSPSKSFNNQTYRQLMYVSQGGTSIRIKVTNKFGTTPLTLTSMHVATSAGGSSILGSSDVTITFNGQQSVTVPVGQEIFSDAVSFAVAPLSTLAVSTYVAAASLIETNHNLGVQTNYVAAGNVVATPSITPTETNTFYTWVSGIDVTNSETTKVIVAFGDSITDGYNSTLSQNNRYPNVLSRALINAGVKASVVNSGISGNRWIYDGIGPNGVGRFSKDVIGVSGATHVISLLGINDIGIPGAFGRPASETVTAAQLITAITNAATAARRAGLKFYAGTLTPFAGTTFPGYYTAAGEVTRQAVNTFIRTTSAIDGFIDYDAVIRDPANPTFMLPAYNSGDNLHPNDAGYAAMAAAAANFLR